MRLFALSDIHVDYSINRRWLSNLSFHDYQNDVLILAGDVTDDLRLLERCLTDLSSRFRHVLFVPGNHELWIVRDDFKTSIDKFHKIIDIAEDCGVTTNIVDLNAVSIVPLFGWYDFSFGIPSEKLKNEWSDFYTCRWPDGYSLTDVHRYFLDQNIDRLNASNSVVISFSHFLPRIELMPSYIPATKRYLYPVLGSTVLGAQVEKLKPTIHIYGHSHVNLQVEFRGIKYVNNAFGYPGEQRIARKKLLCVYEI